MTPALRSALVLALALCASGQEVEDARAPKAVAKLNTLVIGPDHFEPVSATPTVTRTKLTISSEPLEPVSRLVVDAGAGDLSTKTIYGFLDFITTVGDTVMVFTPGAKTQGAEEAVALTTKPASPAARGPSPSAHGATHRLHLRHGGEASPAGPLRGTGTLRRADALPDAPHPARPTRTCCGPSCGTRSPTDRRPFILPQRRRGPAFLSASPASVVPDTAPAALQTSVVGLRTSVVGLVTASGGTVVSGDLTTVHTTSVIGTMVDGEYTQLLQSSSVIFAAPPVSPTVTRASSIIEGAATEFPQLPAPVAEPEVAAPRAAVQLTDEPAPAANHVSSLQERLKARMQAALDVRPSREVAAPERRPFTLGYEPGQRARAARPFRPEIPLLPRRSFSTRQNNSRRLSAAERLKQRLLQQRGEEPAPASPDTPDTPIAPTTAPTIDPSAPIESDELRIIAVNTYRPQDASDYYYELTTLKTMHPITIGRHTNSKWLTATRTRTVHVQPTAPTRTTPRIAATALPLSLTYSTTQLVLKSSVIPLVIGDNTQAFTITQSYQVTRLVTALKTMPPMEVFRTAAPPGLVDRDRPLLAQSSENQVDALGVPVLRVPPPDDLADIGLFDADRLEEQESPEHFGLQAAATAAPAAATPAPQPRAMVTSSPVFVTTVVTSTHSRAVVVTFRASPSTAYITSTSVFPTVLTSYVTSTVQMPALG
ncbi:uncharacterized protein LOC119107461 [Pollicipes pollicipes]|uniref:uncharacterized protein LOC119107461 n=1 Tax=Pollicipes pollicipes TaxID=41117 RepID=UPI00188544B7|nr:uncharacterized protein LOC119107461 [Pollicipes pollicipes]